MNIEKWIIQTIIRPLIRDVLNEELRAVCNRKVLSLPVTAFLRFLCGLCCQRVLQFFRCRLFDQRYGRPVPADGKYSRSQSGCRRFGNTLSAFRRLQFAG